MERSWPAGVCMPWQVFYFKPIPANKFINETPEEVKWNIITFHSSEK
jgi:hypothetical protein